MGIHSETVTKEYFGDDVRSYGLLKENLRLTYLISGRVSGWIEDLKVTAIGDEVKKGDLILTLYSPDLISAQQDYISALNNGIKGRIVSSAKRLKSLGDGEKALEQIRSEKKKLDHFPFYAETDGIISKLMINKGSYIKSGQELALIQNYSSVWVNVNIAEKDLQFITKESRATVSFPNLGGIDRLAKIDYIYQIGRASCRERVSSPL